MIMIEGPDMEGEKAEGTMREAVVTVADTIAVEAGAGAEVVACKQELHLIQAHKEMQTRKRHQRLAT